MNKDSVIRRNMLASTMDSTHQFLARVDRSLADIFHSIWEGMRDIGWKGEFSKKVFSHSIERFVDRERNIRIVPSTKNIEFHEISIGKAFDKWRSQKGFKGIIENVINYWNSSKHHDYVTLVYTSSWDELDFNIRYKDEFDKYVNNTGRTVCVILLTSNTCSVQYLNRGGLNGN